MVFWLSKLIAVPGIAAWIGWTLGRRCAKASRAPRPGVGFAFLAVFVAATVAARIYAETDRPGWAWAEWFAYGGKWYTLLAFVGFGISRVAGAERATWAWSRRLVVLLTFACVIATAGWFTFPIYPLVPIHSRRNPSGHVKQGTIYSCGPTCLANYLEMRGGKARNDERELVRLCGTTIEGTAMNRLYRAARRRGIRAAEPRRMSLADLEKSGKPAIILISTLPDVRHAALLVKFDGTNAHMVDPDYGYQVTDLTWLDRVIYGKAIVLE